MSKKHNLRTKLSELEFVEELSDIELEAVAGGQAPPTPQTGIRALDQLLSNLRSQGEGQFRRQFPELTPIVFPLSGGN
jgi:hypothetical protein